MQMRCLTQQGSSFTCGVRAKYTHQLSRRLDLMAMSGGGTDPNNNEGIQHDEG